MIGGIFSVSRAIVVCAGIANPVEAALRVLESGQRPWLLGRVPPMCVPLL